jgi:hypothetical protein
MSQLDASGPAAALALPSTVMPYAAGNDSIAVSGTPSAASSWEVTFRDKQPDDGGTL